MCRSIKRLRTPERPPTDEELRAAALQFVRKVSGYHKPSQANQEAFEDAVTEVAAATRAMFERLTSPTSNGRARTPVVALPVESLTSTGAKS